MRALLTAACGIMMTAGIGAASADHFRHHHHHHGYWHGQPAGVRVIHPGSPAVIERRVAVPVPVAVPVDRPVPVIVERRVAVPVAVPVLVQPQLQTWSEPSVVHHPAPVYYGHPVVVERRCWVQHQPVYNAFGDIMGLQPQRVCR